MNELSLTPLLESYARMPSPGLMEQLVEGFLPLSHAIARRFIGHGVELDDLQQVAAMALMKAIERFEPERGLKFTTFAAPTITGEVRNYIRDKGSIMRMSRDARSQLYRMQQVQERLTVQIRDCIQQALDPIGVAVVIEASHMCMQMRGVESQQSATTTSAFTGIFLKDTRTREEFLTLISNKYR